MSDLALSPFKVARDLGMRCEFPEDDELFIDIDSDADLVHYFAMKEVLTENKVQFFDERITPSTTEGHFHIRVRLAEGDGFLGVITPEMRIALQAAMGSDRKRELLSALRILCRLDRPPTVFFEKEA